ncbi:MAG: bifunctional folylpolyglutamate synthase/dihydrofolate synthase [Candidatus Omnitrophica bacterium]|nr:bifunctional folylpolyglutamate synthase/dihydrofolate synthase [Candidatus Omnitrophota bacterium]
MFAAKYNMDYNATLDYIDSFINFEKIPQYSYASSFNLERQHTFLRELGNPHKDIKTIHIAGSKGKGSTCAIVTEVLKSAGYRVGLYTSPHLLDVRERIRVLDEVIGEAEFTGLIERIKGVAERFRNHQELGRLSFFEILTTVAFLYFKEKDVDFAVLETGLGGRLDATNVTQPIVCGITNISKEHTDKLGDSLEEITREKAGIIKAKGIVVSTLQERDVIDVIRKVCEEKEAKLLELGNDIKYSIIESNEFGQVFNLDAQGYSYKGLEINLIGRHQVENAALAIGMLRSCVDIEEGALRAGLRGVPWPGRLQVIQRGPYVILDGAQNVVSIKAVLSSIKEIFCYKRFICIFGISSDKDIKGVSAQLDTLSDMMILSCSQNERAVSPGSLKEHFSKPRVEVRDSVNEALDLGLRIARKEDLILVTGSLYVVGEAMRFFKEFEYSRPDFEQEVTWD